MKKYLKELEISGIAMMFIGIIMGRLLGSDICTLIIIIGMLLSERKGSDTRTQTSKDITKRT